jgi:class 3 adenylate cyclase
MVFFNDPLPCQEPAAAAVRLAVDLQERMADLCMSWRRQGWELGFGVGIAHGYATLGAIGFEGRMEYGVIGTVVNLASRLCDEAAPGEILLSQRAFTLVENLIQTEPLPELALKGFSRPVPAYRVAVPAVARAGNES